MAEGQIKNWAALAKNFVIQSFQWEKGNKQVGPDRKYEPIYNLNKNMCSRYFEASIPAVSSRGNTIQGTDWLLRPEF